MEEYNEYINEEKDNIIFNLRGWLHGVCPEPGWFKGFGICHTCQFGDITGEQEPHVEGLGMITTGVNITCEIKKPYPKGLILAGQGLQAEEICPWYVPNICELCDLIGFHRDCKECIWKKND